MSTMPEELQQSSSKIIVAKLLFFQSGVLEHCISMITSNILRSRATMVRNSRSVLAWLRKSIPLARMSEEEQPTSRSLPRNMPFISIADAERKEFISLSTKKGNCSCRLMPPYPASRNGPRLIIDTKAIRMIGSVQVREFITESANLERELA